MLPLSSWRARCVPPSARVGAISVLLLILLAACIGGGSDPTATPTREVTPTATAVPTSTPSPTQVPSPTPAPTTGTLTVHYIDVGQGDATLLQGPDFTILIDTGTHTGDEVVPYLQSVGVTSLDLLIGTHPHADHIGQIPQVMEAFPVGEVWLSGDPHTTLTFERAIDAIEASDAGYHEPRAGETYTFGSATLQVINPAHLTGEFNGGSISVRILFDTVAFVFTGDAEENSEQEMLERGHELSAQVLQLGHHGSRTSSSSEFLAVVDPEIAIYSAGTDNDYGHPHAETVDRIAGLGIPLYGTDIHGTIIVTTDGVTYEVFTERGDGPRLPLGVSPTATQTVVPTGAAGICQPGQVDINSATAEELETIIHIGPERANDIISLRPFNSVDSLTRVSGIGPATLDDIKAEGIACAD